MENQKPLNDHFTSLRLPKSWDIWVKDFALQWDVSAAYVYRAAVKEFIRSKSDRPDL